MALIVQLFAVINFGSLIKIVGSNPLKIFLLSNATFFSILVYISGAYMLEGIRKSKKSYMFPMILTVPYITLLLIFVFIWYDPEIIQMLDAKTSVWGRFGTVFLEFCVICEF
jgi:hypothetical protein